jgi:cytochrome c oxidase subunit 4
MSFLKTVTNNPQAQGSEPITAYKGMLVQSKSAKDLGMNEKINDE